jgi:hypothetical protein
MGLTGLLLNYERNAEARSADACAASARHWGLVILPAWFFTYTKACGLMPLAMGKVLLTSTSVLPQDLSHVFVHVLMETWCG